MDSFKIQFKRSAEQDIRRIDPGLIPSMLGQIETLADNPFPRQSFKLTGAKGTYRLRIGDYRVIYGVNKSSRTIMIYYIRHRREAYRKL